MEQILDELHSIITERMNDPIVKLENQDFIKNIKALKNNLYDNIILKLNDSEIETLQKLLEEIDILNSYYEQFHYQVGFLDGI